MTDTSQTRLAYIPEVTYGVTPATPAFKNLRFTGENFKIGSQYVSSNEIRADRSVADSTLVAREAAGGFGFELSYGSFDDMLEALLQGTWATNVLKNGTTLKSFTFEKTMKGITDQYHRYTGQVISAMQLAIKAREMVTGTFTTMGKAGTTAQAIIASATYAAVNTNPVINAANNVAGLGITGITAPKVMELNLSIDNNMRQQPVIGDLFSKGVGAGRCNVSGDMTLYFETQEAYDLYLADTYTDLTFTLGGLSTLKYVFVLPKIKLTDGEVINGGNDQDVMLKVPFTAVYGTSDAASIKITRTP